MRLSWVQPSGGAAVTHYEYELDGSDTWTSTAGPATNYTVRTLTNGQTYTFRVRAVNSAGPSTATAQRSAAPRATAPDAPTGLSATPGNEQVTLRWRAPANDGGDPITDYEYEQNSDGTWTSTRGPAPSYTVPDQRPDLQVPRAGEEQRWAEHGHRVAVGQAAGRASAGPRAGPRAPDSNPDPPGAGGVGPRGAAPGPWRVSPPGPARVTRSSPRAAAEVSPAKLGPADARAAADPIASVSHQQCWPVRRSSVSWSETPQAGQVCCVEIWRAGSAWILGHMPTSRMRDGLQGSTAVKAAGVEPPTSPCFLIL